MIALQLFQNLRALCHCLSLIKFKITNMLVPIIFQLLCLVTLITGIPLVPRQGPGSGKVIIGYKNLKPVGI